MTSLIQNVFNFQNMGVDKTIADSDLSEFQ